MNEDAWAEVMINEYQILEEGARAEAYAMEHEDDMYEDEPPDENPDIVENEGELEPGWYVDDDAGEAIHLDEYGNEIGAPEHEDLNVEEIVCDCQNGSDCDCGSDWDHS